MPSLREIELNTASYIRCSLASAQTVMAGRPPGFNTRFASTVQAPRIREKLEPVLAHRQVKRRIWKQDRRRIGFNPLDRGA